MTQPFSIIFLKHLTCMLCSTSWMILPKLQSLMARDTQQRLISQTNAQNFKHWKIQGENLHLKFDANFPYTLFLYYYLPCALSIWIYQNNRVSPRTYQHSWSLGLKWKSSGLKFWSLNHIFEEVIFFHLGINATRENKAKQNNQQPIQLPRSFVMVFQESTLKTMQFSYYSVFSTEFESCLIFHMKNHNCSNMTVTSDAFGIY